MNRNDPSKTIALTHQVSPRFAEAELTYVGREPIDLELAREQHEQYRRLLERFCSEVVWLSMNVDFPDGVFIEDTAIVLPECAILCSMGANSRRDEPARVYPFLLNSREVIRIERPATIEGGDVLRVGRTLFAGLSTRTNLAGIQKLATIVEPFGYRVIKLEVPRALHLKTALCAVEDDRLIVNRNWIQLPDLADFDVIAIPDDEPWGANLIRFDRTMVMSDAHRRTADLISDLGLDVRTVDISEFSKAEGGVTCLSLIIE